MNRLGIWRRSSQERMEYYDSMRSIKRASIGVILLVACVLIAAVCWHEKNEKERSARQAETLIEPPGKINRSILRIRKRQLAILKLTTGRLEFWLKLGLTPGRDGGFGKVGNPGGGSDDHDWGWIPDCGAPGLGKERRSDVNLYFIQIFDISFYIASAQPWAEQPPIPS